MGEMLSVRDRIEQLRRRDGIKSARDAAARWGIGYEMAKKLISGERGLSDETAESIASHHRVSLAWLKFGEGSLTGSLEVPIIGFVAAGNEVVLFDDIRDAGETTSVLADPDSSSALVVKGDSMHPLARDGDTIFVGAWKRELTRMVNSECAVVLQDGRALFKTIRRGSRPGFYDLLSYNAADILDQEVLKAAQFLGLKRASR